MFLLLLPFFDDDDDDDGLLILLFVVARVDEDGKLVTDDEFMRKGKELSILTKCCCWSSCWLCFCGLWCNLFHYKDRNSIERSFS